MQPTVSTFRTGGSICTSTSTTSMPTGIGMSSSRVLRTVTVATIGPLMLHFEPVGNWKLLRCTSSRCA